MKRLIALLILLSSVAFAATTTTISGTVSDLSGTPATSGQITFTLQPSVDSTISGVARFTPGPPVVCGIDGTGAIKNANLNGACTLVKNTTLTPQGTSYKAQVCPAFACTSSLVFYATTDTLDFSTVSPTPASLPIYGLVDLTSTQIITGAKTFTGTVTFSGTFPSLAATAISSGTFNSTAANSASSGVLNAANNACIVAARNAGNSADVCTIKLNTSNQVVLGTAFVVPAVADQAVGRATVDTLSNKTISSPSITSPTITGNMTYASTTPVANLTASNHPTVFNASGTQQTNTHIVADAASLTAGSVTVTLTGSAVFTSSVSYQVVPVDATAVNAVKIAKISGSQFTITGTSTDLIGWIAIGN